MIYHLLLCTNRKSHGQNSISLKNNVEIECRLLSVIGCTYVDIYRYVHDRGVIGVSRGRDEGKLVFLELACHSFSEGKFVIFFLYQ